MKTELRNNEGQLHCENGPAIVWPDGTKEWFIEGKRHREDGPAIERSNGDKVYYFNDKLHREDGPAIDKTNGDQEYWLNGQLHRENGPAKQYKSINWNKYYWKGEQFPNQLIWNQAKIANP